MGKLFISEHPLIQHKMAMLRDKNTSTKEFRELVNEITKFDYDFDLVSGRYVIDAKSIMGIFSLDLSKPIDLNIHADSNVDDILAALDAYIIK